MNNPSAINLIISHVTGRPLTYLHAHPEYTPTPKQQKTIAALTARLNQSEPLAYLLGQKDFYGRTFKITPHVLIPRPETESIIDLAKTIHQSHPRPLRIADIGTGSGIIAITLSLELPASHITATDISKPALQIARRNAKSLNAPNITFRHANLFSNPNNKPSDFAGELQPVTGQRDVTTKALATKPVTTDLRSGPATGCSTPAKSEHFNLICANLPYVNPSWPWLKSSPSLSYEPPTALYAPDQGLSLIKKLIHEAPSHLTPHGHLLLEHDPTQQPPHHAVAKYHHVTPHPTHPHTHPPQL
jgi:release factor glutamine methyltransferase